MQKVFISFFALLTFNVATAQFKPSSLSGLELWYRSDTGVSVVGGQVIQWMDVSGNNKHLYQNTLSFQPLSVDSISQLNNYPVIQLDGTDDVLLLDSLVTVGSVFVVLNWGGALPNFPEYNGILSQQSYADSKVILLANSGTTNLYTASNIFFKSNEVFVNGYQTLSFAPLEKYKIVSGVGIQQETLGNFLVGRESSTASRQWNGNIAEIIVYSTLLTLAERQQVEQYLRFKYAPPVNLGADITVSYGFCPVQLNAHKDWFTGYVWNPGTQTTDSIFTNVRDANSVTVTDIFGYTSSDTVNITYPGNFSPFPDTTICYGSSIKWNTQLDKAGYDFAWQDGSTDSVFTISQTGKYYVMVTDTIGVSGCVFISDTITVTVDTFSLIASLGSDTGLCSGNAIGLKVGAQQTISYLWSTGATTSTIVINTSGNYSVTATNTNGCTATDDINVTINGNAPIANFSVIENCLGIITQFSDSSKPTDASNIISWQWDFGDSFSDSTKNPNHLYAVADTFLVSLTVQTDSGCYGNVSKSVMVHPYPTASFSFAEPACAKSPVTFTDSTTLLFGAIASWQWDFGVPDSSSDTSSLQNPSYAFTLQGEYYVKLVVSSTTGCSDSVVKFVKVYSDSTCFAPSQFSGLSLWYKSDTGITISGGQVIQWLDVSGNNKHLYQNTASYQPLFIDSISLLNNYPVVKLDGTDDVLLLDSTVTVGSVFVVVNWAGILPNFPDYNGILSQQSYDVNKDILLGQGSTSNLYVATTMFFKSNEIYVNGNQTLNFAPLDTYKIVSGVGTQIENLSNFLVGRESATMSRHWNGNIAEIIIYSSLLTPAERQQVEQYLRFKYAPPVNIGADIVMPNLCDTTLDAGIRFKKFQWNNSATDTLQTLTVTKPGTYFVKATDIFGFDSYDTVAVGYPFTQLAAAHLICSDSTMVWNTNLDTTNYTFQWNTGDTVNSFIFINQQGQYAVTVTEVATGCALASDSINVNIDSFPTFNFLNNDTSLCKGNSITTLIPAGEYAWSTGDTSVATVIDVPNTYYVTVTNSIGCIGFDSIQIIITGTAPTVKFSATEVCLGSGTLFSDSSFTTDSSNIISYQWSFGDNSSDTAASPSHTYTGAGTYNVSLTVYTDSACSNALNKNVIVHALPQVNFNAVTSPLCSKESIQFLNLSQAGEGDIVRYSWDFEDGAQDTLTDPVHVFDTGGNFNVELNAENSFGCIDSFSKNIYINAKPVAAFFSVSACEDDTVKFLDNSQGIVTQWNWNFGNGKNAAVMNPSCIYDTAGTYPVSVIVSTIFNCRDTVAQYVNVHYKPKAGFITTDFCRGTPIQQFDSSTVTGSSIAQWNWTVLNTNIVSSEKEPFFNFDTNAANSYLLKLKVKSAKGCTDSVIKIINIHNPPAAEFSFSPLFGDTPLTVDFTNLSNDAALSWNWNFGTGDSSVLENPSYLFTDSGKFTLQLIAYSQFGCTDTFVKTIQVRKTFLDIAVTKVRTSTSNNFLKISADLYNTGNVPISNFEIFSEIAGFPAIKENWNGFLEEKSAMSYSLNSSFELRGNNMPDIICVRIENPNSKPDADSSNNEMCISFSDFKVLSIYPNPATNEIIVEYVLTGEAENLQIIIYDEIGKQVEELLSENGQKGLHRVKFDISKFSNGIYALKIIYGENYEVKQFMK